ncbi:type VI secretion system tip protein VgrG, partial [Brenneria populi subsp. brevivirga]|nr:type VI secretion system tip protein VgrG [Brenneria populi subsp. brevivirga]
PVMQRMSAASLTIPPPNMPLAKGYSEHFIIKDQETGEPLAGVPYTIAYQQQQITGITDNQGKTTAVYSLQPEQLTLQPHIERFNRQFLQASYWDDDRALNIDFSRTDKEDEPK